MKRIAYVSTCALDLSDADVEMLVAAASQRNDAHDLTGLLAFNGTNFIQALEGDDAAVDQLFAKIKRDERHSGVITLVDEACEERLFPDWRMRYVRAAPGPLLNGGVALSADDLEDCAHIAALFSGFVRLRGT